MKQIVLILAVAAVGSASFESGLRIKFNLGLNVGKDFFFEMPRTVGKAVDLSWTKLARPPSPLPSLPMYCEPTLVLCCLYDFDTEYIAAVQVGLPLDQFTGFPFDWTIQGFIPWNTHYANGTSITVMTKQVYLISEETLAKPKEERLKAAEADKVLQEDHVWPMGFHQKRMAVPTNVAGIVKAGFTKQSCIPWMGRHYFYNMTTETECKSDTLANWFTLVDSDELIGIGFLVIGVMPEKKGENFYFERPSEANLKVIVKTCPDCFANLAGNPTGTTMHIYFINEPWHVGCWSL